MVCAPLQSLTGLLPIIPGAQAALLDELSSAALGSLLATNRQLFARRQLVHDHVSGIGIATGTSVVPLCTWPNLATLDLSYSGMSEEAVAVLARGGFRF